MKNIFTLLSEIGLEIPEDKKTSFETTFNENYKTVSELNKVREARDNYQSQLETAQNALKEFEGIDVEDLQEKITSLTNNLNAKETEYQNKIADMEFNATLEGELSKFGARNVKAVKALLDLDMLKTSKNQAEDIKTALETVKGENDYLFTSDEPIKNPVKETNNPPSPNALNNMMRNVMGLKEKE